MLPLRTDHDEKKICNANERWPLRNKSKIFKGFWGQGKDDFDRKFYVEGGLLHGSWRMNQISPWAIGKKAFNKGHWSRSRASIGPGAEGEEWVLLSAQNTGHRIWVGTGLRTRYTLEWRILGCRTKNLDSIQWVLRSHENCEHAKHLGLIYWHRAYVIFVLSEK